MFSGPSLTEKYEESSVIHTNQKLFSSKLNYKVRNLSERFIKKSNGSVFLYNIWIQNLDGNTPFEAKLKRTGLVMYNWLLSQIFFFSLGNETISAANWTVWTEYCSYYHQYKSVNLTISISKIRKYTCWCKPAWNPASY